MARSERLWTWLTAFLPLALAPPPPIMDLDNFSCLKSGMATVPLRSRRRSNEEFDLAQLLDVMML